jgi:predicted acetyltransferase
VIADPAAARGPNPVLRLRPLQPGDEAAFRDGHETMAADGFTFRLGSRHVSRRGRCGELVGRSSIRHGLTEFLEREGGHIGYGVLPAYRRRGHATEILRQSLVIARAIGVDRVLAACDDTNIGSIAVIEACGGRLDNVVESAAGGTRLRRYWID